MSTEAGYRYPGSGPFEDTDLDRLLFFGRDREKEDLLQKIMAKRLVVLFGRSGLGKTSLVNAGVNPLLREKGFVPLKVRFNHPGIDPLQAVLEGIKKSVNHEQYPVDYEPGEEQTLWQFFKTANFWSPQNTLLTPVLILDQFEEFFTFHSTQSMNRFILQLADLVNGTIPTSVRKSIEPGKPFSYDDKPPDVKVLISIREDFLYLVEELAEDIPDVFNNRFRLRPLTKDQAMQAVIHPSQVEDDRIRTACFRYSSEALELMLNFLCKRKPQDDKKVKDEVESFQLQLLCRNIENKIRGLDPSSTSQIPKNQIKSFPGVQGRFFQKEPLGAEGIRSTAHDGKTLFIITDKALGGETGIRKVLEDFYDERIRVLGAAWKKRRMHGLFEKGLISVSDRRLSVQEEELQRRFSVSADLLGEFVKCRLIRFERRAESVYYELSHDTLIEPIRESQRKRRNKHVKYGVYGVIGVFLILLLIIAWFYQINKEEKNYSKNVQEGNLLFYNKKYEKSIDYYTKATEAKPDDAYAYRNMGIALSNVGKYTEAIDAYEKAVEIKPDDADAYYYIGNALIALGKYPEAIDAYKKTVEINPRFFIAYYTMGNAFNNLKRYQDAIDSYKKTLRIKPGLVEAYFKIGNALDSLKRYPEAVDSYKKAIEFKPDYAEAYYKMGNASDNLGKYPEAVEAFKKAIEIKPDYANAYNNMGFSLYKQGKNEEAVDAYKKAIELNPGYAYAYNNMGSALFNLHRNEEALTAYREALEINPGYLQVKTNISELYFFKDDFDSALSYARDALKSPNTSIDFQLAMRQLSISALVLQGKQMEAKEELRQFIDAYRTIKEEYNRQVIYKFRKDYIEKNKTLNQSNKNLLLKLIEILESKKPEGDKKLSELEEMIK